jgi:hypothetical protein
LLIGPQDGAFRPRQELDEPRNPHCARSVIIHKECDDDDEGRQQSRCGLNAQKRA